MNIQLVGIRTTRNASGDVIHKLFTFVFENGAQSSVGIEKTDLELDEAEQKQKAAQKAWQDAAHLANVVETQQLDETINL